MPFVDCYAWLAMNTAGPEFSIDKITNYLSNISVWCASPQGPRLVSDKVLVHEIKSLFTQKWYRSSDTKSFESFWRVTSLSL